MTTEQNNTSVSTTGGSRYRPLKITVGILLFLVCAFLGLQLGGRLYLQKWLVENGADTATIKSIRLNPFTGQASLNGVDIQVDGKTVLGNSTIAINVGLQQLFGHEALLQNVLLKDVRLDFEQYADGAMRIGSYKIEPSTPVDTTASNVTQAAEAQIPWIFSTAKVSLQNIILTYHRPDLAVELAVEEGHLEDFTTSSSGHGGRLFLKGSLNGAELLIDLTKLKIAPNIELAGKISLDSLPLDDLGDLLRDALPRFGGVAGLDGELNFIMKDGGDIETTYKGGLLLDKIGIGQQTWSTTTSSRWDGDIFLSMNQTGLQVNTDGSLQLDAPVFGMGEGAEHLEVSGAGVNWSGKVAWQQQGDQQLLTTAGTLRTEQLAGDIGPAKLKFDTGSLGGDINLRLIPSAMEKLEGTASLGTEALQLELGGEPLLSLTSIDIAGIEAKADSGVRVATVDTNNLILPVSTTVPVGVKVEKIALKSVASNDLKTVDADQISISHPEVMDGEGTTLLADLAGISAQTIHLDENMGVTIKEVTGSGSKFMQKDGTEPMATLGGFSVADLSYTGGNGLAITNIQLTGLRGSAIREKSDKTEQVDTATHAELVESKEQQPAAAPAGIPVKISRIQLDDTSGFTFTDKTLSTPFSTTLDLKSLLVEGVDLTNPANTFTYTLDGTVNHYAQLSIDGKAAPLGTHPAVSQKTRLQNYSMEAVSPYTIEAIGTYFPAGRLDLTSDLTLAEGKINMKNNLLIKEVESKTVDGELAAKLNNQLPVPLDLALTMLKDSKGTIDLDIPLKGELSSMNVGIADILITALSKGITVAVAPYLAYTALGPTGALIFVGAKIGQALLNTDLPSLQFAPGTTELTEEHIKVLTSVGPKIKKDEKTSYSICAKVNQDELTAEGTDSTLDHPELLKKLFSLGEQRSEVVKSYLMQTFAIDEQRLLICNPALNFEKGAVPTIEFKK